MQIGRALRFHMAKNAHGQYCVPVESMHRPCALTVMRGRVWEAATLKAIARHYRGGDIVTAGTYFGDFLPFLCRQADAHGAHVWGFEPVTVNYLCASATRAFNALTNCTLANAGLGSEPGRLTIKTHDNKGRPLGGGSRIVVKREGLPAARFDAIEIATIDAVVDARSVGLIQLDIEGHEIAALRGASAVIERCRPLLVLEGHGGADLPADPYLRELSGRFGYHRIDRQDQNVFLAAGTD